MADPIVISKSRDLFKLVEDKLNEAMSALDQKERVSVEFATTLENFTPKSARGGFGILFNGKNYSKDPRILGPSLIMKDDTFIGIITVARFNTIQNQPIEKWPMLPMEYTELVVDALSGIEVWNKRPENENKIYPVRTELIDETAGNWKYLTSFGVPLDFVEKELREN